MAEKETKNKMKDLIEATPEELENIELPIEEVIEVKEPQGRFIDSWKPRTKLGEAVKSGKEKNIDVILEHRKKILEPEIVDSLMNLDTELLSIGQAKGKFGGGKRRAWRQTQKKTMEGNVLSFSAMVAVGDRKGHIGLGYGRSKETLPAREKAIRNAKLNVTKINLGFESPEHEKHNSIPHTVPFKAEGKCGSVRVTLWPAPRGTGLVAGAECKKILSLAGVKDVYSRTTGKTKTTFNLAKACVMALEKTTELKL